MTQTPARTTTPTPAGRPTPPPLVRLVGTSAGLGAVLVVLLALFILPSLKSGPHDLPVGLVGDSASTSEVVAALEAAAPDAYDVERFDTADDLAQAVRDRDVVGGLVVGPDDLEVVVASAGSPAIAGALSASAEAVGAADGTEVRVTDLVPLPEGDPSGLGIGGLAFPLVFGGIVPVVAFGSLFPHSLRWRLAGLTVFAGVGGLLVAGVLRFWFGSIETAFWPVAGAMALGIAALALPLAGLKQLVGAKGFTLGAMTMMFLGNPLAGMATTGAWLPAGLGTVGQLLPPGAAGALVRSAAYFHGAGALVPILTLVTWVVVGLVLYVVGARRHPRPAV